MKIQLDIPDYIPEEGLKCVWEENFTIEVSLHKTNKAVLIRANKEGLISLARHLLLLANSSVPNGNHFHFDDYNSLEDNSIELIIEKTNI